MQRKKYDVRLYLGKDYVLLQSNCIKSGIMPTNRPLALRLSKNQFKEQNRWQRW